MNQDDFAEYVRQLWPTARWGDAELQAVHAQLRRFGYEAVREVLWRCKQDNLDATRPQWSAVKRMLLADIRTEQGRCSELQVTLNSMRAAAVKQGETRAKHWTDAEVFQAFLDAQTYPITHYTVAQGYSRVGEPRVDSDGVVAKAAALEREKWARFFRSDLEDRREPVPEYL